MTCDACLFSVGAVRTILEDENNKDIILHIGALGCSLKFKLSVCKGVIRYFGDHFVKAILTYPSDPSYVCGNYLGVCSTSKYEVLREEDFIQQMLSDKPAEIQNDDFI